MNKHKKGKNKPAQANKSVELYNRDEVIDYCLSWYEASIETAKSARDAEDYTSLMKAAANAFDTADYLSTCDVRSFNRTCIEIINEIQRLEVETLVQSTLFAAA